MTRTMTPGMQTAIAAQRGEYVHFFQIDNSGGSVHLCTAPVSISWNSQTWQGIGGSLSFGGIEETPDFAGQGVELTLSGVDQTIISGLLNHHVRGYEVRIWHAHIDNGQVIEDPLEIFRGRQLANYNITDVRQKGSAGTCTVSTRVASRLSAMKAPIAIRTNETSHNDMLKRAGLPTGDTFFRNTAGISGRVIRWGPYVIGSKRTKPTRIDHRRDT